MEELSYIYYSLFLIIALFTIAFFQRRKVALKKLLMIALPIFLLTQLYFWNSSVNDYVKSFLFNTEVYNCQYLEGNTGNDIENNTEKVTVPLPKRTVFNSKYDGCSENYVTYTSPKAFKAFYDKELQLLKSRGEIVNFNVMRDVKVASDTDTEAFGYKVEHTHGKIEIILYVKEGTDKGQMSIEFNPQK
jgi:hypothetical protein